MSSGQHKRIKMHVNLQSYAEMPLSVCWKRDCRQVLVVSSFCRNGMSNGPIFICKLVSILPFLSVKVGKPFRRGSKPTQFITITNFKFNGLFSFSTLQFQVLA